MKTLLRCLLFGFMLTVLAAPFRVDKVWAAHECRHAAPEQIYGRNANCGYYLNNSWNGYAPYGSSGVGLLTGIPDNLPGSFTALEGVGNVDQFVSVMRYHLQNNCTPGGGANDSRRRNSAAFIILTMQGAPAGTPANAPCVSSAYHVDRWESLVRQYDSAGLINYNEQGWYNRNTRLQPPSQDIAWYPDCAAFGICIEPSIIVRAPNGSVLYMIKRDCANPIGIPGALTPLSHGFNVNPTADVTFSPNQDAPTSATFETGASYTGSPSITTYTRLFFYIRAGTATEVPIQVPSPSPHTRTNNGTSFSFADETLNIAALGLGAGDRVCARITVTPAAGTAGPSGAVLSISVPSRTTTSCETVVQIPYHQVYGGDVRAGSGFLTGAGSCATDTEARIIGHSRNGAPDYTGAGSQLAAYVFDTVAFFASGQLRTNATAPRPLTFANVNPSRNNFGGAGYGGGLMDGQAVCAPNYYDDGIGEATNVLGSTTGANISEGVYRRTGNLNITGGNLGLGTGHRIIYVEGDVTISGNITYAGGNYNDIGHIPGFRLIVRGNIYVEPGVNQLDGVYAAQPRTDGTRGRFYTCGPGGAPPDAGEINGICRSNKLIIHGSVMADLIKLTRSGGTLSQSANTALAPAQDAASSNAAEVIIMTPEAWLTSNFTGSGEFDSVTTLPPVL